jgi:hypothetical protein
MTGDDWLSDTLTTFDRQKHDYEPSTAPPRPANTDPAAGSSKAKTAPAHARWQ